MCQSNTKKTNLSCICQKSEFNSQEIGVFRCFGGISVIRRTAQKVQFFFDGGGNIVKKGKNAGYPAFSPFPTKFSKGFLQGDVKSGHCALQAGLLTWQQDTGRIMSER